MNNLPIGVFDSGFGGLSVFKEIVAALPCESVIYYGDGGNCPYGGRSVEDVIFLADRVVRFLVERGVKMVVVACNTATAAAISYLRSSYSIPFVGMEPAVKPAARQSRSGIIAILATAATLRGGLFLETAERFSGDVTILSSSGEGFVELIEAGLENSLEAELAVRRTVEPLLERGADHLVLGCTHYPFLTDVLLKVIGDRDVTLVDPAPAIAARVKDVLSERGELADGSFFPVYSYFCSGDEHYRRRLEERGQMILARRGEK